MVCKECGGPSESTYCSRLCANRFWKKSPGFLKNKCKVCGNPCHNIYCSKKCKASTTIVDYKENCLTCGKEFIFKKIAYKKRGQMKYCSYKCAKTLYHVDETFFTHYSNIPLLYQTLGFLFASGRIQDYGTHDIDVNSTKENIENFTKVVNSTYPIFQSSDLTGNKDIYRTKIKCKTWQDYLSYIGFGCAAELHTFPIILEEYILDFIKGYIKSNMSQIYIKEDHRLIFLKTKSYSLARGIADFTNSEVVTKHLGFIIVIKDENNVY